MSGMRIDPERVMAAIRHRRTIKPKDLKPDAVDDALVRHVLEAARWAPCHGRTEPWRFAVFTGDGRRALETAAGEAGNRVWSAPVWIAIMMQPGVKQDGSLAMPEWEETSAVACAVQNMYLMACSLGLGCMWSTGSAMTAPAIQQFLGVQPPARLLGWFIMGWPAVAWPEASRRPVEEIARWYSAAPAQ